MPRWIFTWADWCGARVAIATNLLTGITVPRKFNLPCAISDQTSLLCANVVPTLISPTLYGLLYSVVMFLQQRTKDTRTNNPIDQGVNMYSHDVVSVVVDDDVVVVVDDLELLQRWSPAGQLKLELLNSNSCLNKQQRQLPNMGSEIRWNYAFTPKSFQKLLDSFKNFSNSFQHGRRDKYRALGMEISTLVKTAP